LSGPIQVSDPGDVTRVTGQPQGPCHIRHTPAGDLPDPQCTPGAYDPTITAETLCDSSYSTRSYRPSSSETTRFKYQVAYPAYGLSRDEPSQLDHLVLLDLAGANDGANLWPQPGGPHNAKDTVEGDLHDWMCLGITPEIRAQRLHDAQLAIAHNWTTAEQVLGIK
jgi:hypothetical protein